jgi:signal transduction histidine kinase/CHASE3 domain sensor protein
VRQRFPGLRGGLTARAVIVSVLLAALGGLFGAILVVNFQQRDARQRLRQARVELATAQQLLQRVTDIQTGERGFVLTGEERFLDSWRPATSSFGRESEQLIALSERPSQVALARQVAEKGMEYIRDYSVPLIVARRRGDRSATTLAAAAEGERRMGALRATLGRYAAAEQRDVVGRQDRVDAAGARSIAVATGGLIGSIALIVLISVYLRTAIVLPVRRAAGMAVRLAGGDLTTRMPARSVGEIGELESAFNRMGRSLEAGRDELRGLVEEQAALRRVATLVGAGGTPDAIFGAVSDEVRRLVGIDITSMFRCEPHAMLTLLAVRSPSGAVLDDAIGRRIPMGPALRVMLQSRKPLRLDEREVARWSEHIPEARPLELRASIGVPIIVGGRPWGAIFASATAATRLPPAAEEPFADFTELVATAIANAQARSELSLLAQEQAALRRVATLVIRGASPDAVFDMVAEEVAHVVDADLTAVHRILPEGGTVRIAGWAADGRPLPNGGRRSEEAAIHGELSAGRTVRVTPTGDEPIGSHARIASQRGGRSFIAVPIMVADRAWGAIFAATGKPEPFPADAETRMLGFTELVATAVSAAAARAELAASNERLSESRARVVAAADEERARVVRDLHDGAQQRLVHALITLKMARRTLSAEQSRALELVEEALVQAERANVELRELAHGIMPSVLRHGGLAAGVRSLTGHISLPMDVDVLRERLPSQVEASAYFIIAEALTNILKHANAHEAQVRAFREGDALCIEVRDDGVGGAELTGSTGLLGLQDRAVAVNGSLRVDSPAGGGTRVTATLPLTGDGPSRSSAQAAA